MLARPLDRLETDAVTFGQTAGQRGDAMFGHRPRDFHAQGGEAGKEVETKAFRTAGDARGIGHENFHARRRS